MKTKIREYIEQFFEKFEYPYEARTSLLMALDTVWCEELEALIRIYDKNLKIDYPIFAEKMKEISEPLEVAV